MLWLWFISLHFPLCPWKKSENIFIFRKRVKGHKMSIGNLTFETPEHFGCFHFQIRFYLFSSVCSASMRGEEKNSGMEIKINNHMEFNVFARQYLLIKWTWAFNDNILQNFHFFFRLHRFIFICSFKKLFHFNSRSNLCCSHFAIVEHFPHFISFHVHSSCN